MAIRSPPSSSPKRSTSQSVAMESNSNMKELPQELIVEILFRVSVKSLLKFKCVSKSWLSIISGPNFAKSHFELSAVPTHKLLCFDHCELGYVDPNALFHDHPPMVKFKIPVPVQFFPGIRGSCRGFIMLQYCRNLILWNPSTGVHRTISWSPMESNFDIFYGVLFHGFGYDSSKDDYLIVIAWVDGVTGEIFLEYFSLRTNSWKKLEAELPNDYRLSPEFFLNNALHGDALGGSSFFNLPGFFLNDALHWDALSDSILGFDMIERRFFKIPLPMPSAENVSTYAFLLLGGCLCVLFRTRSYKTEIWVMKEYKVQSSWSMYEFSHCNFCPIYFTECGEIIGQDGEGGLSKYNDRGQIIQHRLSRRYDCRFWMYTESLLSLPSGSGEAGENEQQ